jgi:hypothetical protein
MKLRNRRIASALLAFITLGSFPLASSCNDYSGFWVLDRLNDKRKNHRENFFGPDGKVEIRGYYELFNPVDIYLEHDFGRLKDSLGKCYEVLDTAVQQDPNGSIKGRISTGEWFELPPIIKNQDGESIMREVFEDLGVYDTAETKLASAFPDFKNKDLFAVTGLNHRSSHSMERKGAGRFKIYGVDGRRKYPNRNQPSLRDISTSPK